MAAVHCRPLPSPPRTRDKERDLEDGKCWCSTFFRVLRENLHGILNFFVCCDRVKFFCVAPILQLYYNILPVLFYYGMANSDQEYKMRFRAEIVVLPKNGHFALSAATGVLAGDHDCQVTEEQTKLGLENWFDEYNARELRQIWEAKTATYNQLRTMNSKLDDMQNLLNKMRDGMNQVKQGVASVKQRFGFQDATVAIASQCAMPELTAFLMTIVMHLLVIVAYNMYS
ncbi:truncated ER mannose-binding lectin [Culex quinquefasciatus]|uniref:Truncated ER mannose-binding lectin n=1 Tax=Culex quinquefasciatus TaxID=7176 RepID=B0WLW9_CULQU|nr:truncated ER mannose-binding lectin [Culex quinquefasciatus]|eukprot:XP_001849703.1 truncated ER mannose-binding lectin [Culex quinquefasciatus]